MAIVLFDTNILIDHTLGIMAATCELAGYDDGAVSTVNWIDHSFKTGSKGAIITVLGWDGPNKRSEPNNQ